MQTQAVEDYLKTIYEIQQQQGKVATTVLAEHLKVAPASVTGMIKKLADMHLVSYERYQGVTLTETGQKIALEVIRHHRLVELYLAEALGVPWDQVHDEAEKWEHILSEDLEDRMDEMLGYPTRDPHGAPIPTRDGFVDAAPYKRLTDLTPGQTAVIAEVSDHNADLLRELGDQSLYPATPILVLDRTEVGLTLKRNDEEYQIGHETAEHIYVRDIQD
jgi:DtxR family Mn-dependent transcriptional regulator